MKTDDASLDELREHNRGWFFPRSITILYRKRVINAEQMVLLGYIDALQHPKKGCFASNESLGEFWGKGPTYVSKTITLFARLGLVSILYIQRGQRTERQVRTLYLTEKFRLAEKCKPCRKVQATLAEKCNRVDTSYHKELLTNCGGKDSLRSPRVPATDSFFGSNMEYTPFVMKCVTKLENFIRRARKLNGKRFNRKIWYEAIRLLLQDIEGDKKRLVRVLKTYLTEPHTKFTPSIESATGFREKFLKIETWCLSSNPEMSREPQITFTIEKATQRDLDEIPE